MKLLTALYLLGCSLSCFAQLEGPAWLGQQTTAGSLSPVPDIYWNKFPDGSGTTATATVGPNITTDADWVTGKSGSGYALDFNGTSDDGATVSSVTYNTNIISISLWASPDAFSSFRFLTESSANSGSTPNCSAIYWIGASLSTSASGTTGARTESVVFTPTNTWVFIFALIDNSTATGDQRIWTNGVEATTSITTSTKTGTENFSAQTLFIGARNSGSLFFAGLIDDLRIYSGDRSANISAIMADPQ